MSTSLQPFNETPQGVSAGYGRNEDEVHLGDIWNTIQRHRWIVLGTLFLVFGASIAYALWKTPVYESSATIRIDEKQSNVPALDILKSLSSGNQVSTEMQVLRSRTLADEVADSLALHVTLERPSRIPRAEILSVVHSAPVRLPGTFVLTRREGGRFDVTNDSTGAKVGDAAVGEPFELGGSRMVLTGAAGTHDEIVIAIAGSEAVLRGLSESIKVSRPDREANVVVVTYRSEDQQLVREVPNLLARRFIASRRGIQQTEARSTVQFLHEQIDTLGVQLIAAENELRSFRESAQVVSLAEEATAQVSRLAEMQAQRNTLDAERRALAELLDEVNAAAARQQPGEQSPYRRLIAFPTLFRNQAASTLLASLASVEDQRSQLLIRRTPNDPDVQVLTQRTRDLENQLHGIATTYAQGLTSQVAAIDATVARFGKELEKIPAKEVEFARLTRRPTVLAEIYTMLQTRLKEAEIIQAIEDPSVRVIDPAVMPTEPVAPRKTLLALFGMFGGLGAGIALAFLRDMMDRTLHTREEIQALTGVAVLGLIPQIRGRDGQLVGGVATLRSRLGLGAAKALPPVASGDGASLLALQAPLGGRLVADYDPKNPVAEAYRGLRTNITFARPDNPARVIAFTSALPGEGKSTSSANLAITLAQQGLRVLLVDADLRRGMLCDVFRVPRQPGLSGLLMGEVTIADAANTIPLGGGVELDFISTGVLPPNPAELLGSGRATSLIALLRDKYDMVIFDTPPTNLVTDAAVLGTAVDGVVVVARAAVTKADALSYSMDLLRQVRAPILGVVLNDIDFKRDVRYSAYGGGYYYYEPYAARAQ